MKKITVKGENILNVPNLLSFYRLVISPFLLYLVLSGHEKLFAVFFCISLITDVLDGNIARIFKLQTRFGAALDNLADISTYILAFIGMFIFKWNDINPHAWIFYLFLIVLLLSYIVAYVRFHKIPGLHLFTVVTSGSAQGIFMFVLFASGFYAWLFYTAVILGIVGYIEKIIVLMRLDDIRPGVKGLYWLIREQGKNRKK